MNDPVFSEQWKQTLSNRLKARRFVPYFCETAKEAVSLALSLIDKTASVTFGGGESLSESGLIAALKGNGYTVFDRADVPKEQKNTFAKEHFFSDWFLMSTNAMSEEGELFNIDGMGNRVASLIFGPANVLVLVGKNKIVPTAEEAMHRARNVAAPLNARRLKRDTPCQKLSPMACAGCLSDGCICASLVRTRYSMIPDRIRIIIVNEDLGY